MTAAVEAASEIAGPRSPFDFKTIVVEAEPPALADRRLVCARDLSDRFGAVVVGVGAEVSPLTLRLDPFNDTLRLLNREIDADLKRARENFEHVLRGRTIEWRERPARAGMAMFEASRGADLIVAGGMEQPHELVGRAASIGDLVMRCGRPVLVAPPGGPACSAKKVLVAWKDTREARRAVSDAMPFLVAAEEVLVLAVCETNDLAGAEEGAAEVALSLTRHGVRAHAEAQKKDDGGVAATLLKRARWFGSDLVVAGAYGHSRVGETILGGVTNALLREARCFLFLSH